jgi:hypothetical protein
MSPRQNQHYPSEPPMHHHHKCGYRRCTNFACVMIGLLSTASPDGIVLQVIGIVLLVSARGILAQTSSLASSSRLTPSWTNFATA